MIELPAIRFAPLKIVIAFLNVMLPLNFLEFILKLSALRELML